MAFSAAPTHWLDRRALLISTCYLAAAVAWIWGSDAVVEAWAGGDPARVRALQSLKGTAYVTLTAVLLYGAVRWSNRRQEALAKEKRLMEDMLSVSQRLESLGNLAGSVVHDINNVLTVIHGESEILKLSGYDPAEVPPRLAAIEAATVQAHRIAHDLMQFMRSEPGKKNLGDLADEIERSLPLLRQAATKYVTVTVDIQRPVPAVLYDRSQVERALLNLVLNARDALEGRSNRTLHLTVSAVKLRDYRSLFRRDRTTGTHVVVSVADNGCGISRENFARIFAPFFTTKGPGKGTGLGLASVMSVMQSHGGWVELASEPGKGARFCLYFPEASPTNTVES